ncbi:small basic protein [Murine norovirus GV/CR10/2005/USA]|uniref:Small basic protein n=1 Tax=Murine norovirus GV/CR10/2005/USA TaxID=463724 RepID=A7YK38_NORV|nr:small basic protein [Murine norovirus GV/CR10/2005/USA]
MAGALFGAIGGGLMGIIGNSISTVQNLQANKQLAAQQFGYNSSLLATQIQAQKDLTLMGQQFNQQLQANSFKHDLEMLGAQVQAQAQAQENAINIRSAQLQAAGFSKSDAVRLASGQQPTKSVDWSGTRYYTANQPVTGFSGGFTPSYTPGRQMTSRPVDTSPLPVLGGRLPSLRGGSWSPRDYTPATQGTYTNGRFVSLPKIGSSRA